MHHNKASSPFYKTPKFDAKFKAMAVGDNFWSPHGKHLASAASVFAAYWGWEMRTEAEMNEHGVKGRRVWRVK